MVIFSLYISSFFPLFSGRRAVYCVCVCGSYLIAGCSWLAEVLHVPDHSAPRALLPWEKLALAEVWITQDLVVLTSVRRGSETPSVIRTKGVFLFLLSALNKTPAVSLQW